VVQRGSFVWDFLIANRRDKRPAREPFSHSPSIFSFRSVSPLSLFLPLSPFHLSISLSLSVYHTLWFSSNRSLSLSLVVIKREEIISDFMKVTGSQLVEGVSDCLSKCLTDCTVDWLARMLQVHLSSLTEGLTDFRPLALLYRPRLRLFSLYFSLSSPPSSVLSPLLSLPPSLILCLFLSHSLSFLTWLVSCWSSDTLKRSQNLRCLVIFRTWESFLG
jgi:hypothetical protein